MKYDKPPITTDQQIDLLVSRGMEIADHDRAARYLTHINYYRLRAYWLPFEDATGDSSHSFRHGTRFDHALNLYIFDRKFRLLVLEAIERVEISFRTQFAYILGIKYGSHAYLEAALFKSSAVYSQCLINFREELARSRETFIEHYKNKYDDPELPPIWAACEIMSFGLLSKWLQNLKMRQDRRAVASVYGLDETVLGSFMHHLAHVRNIAAHHSRLWNRRLTVTMTIPNHPHSIADGFNRSDNRKIYNTLVMLCYLLTLMSPGTTWPQRVIRLIEETPLVDPLAMGFPPDWRSLHLWKNNEWGCV